MPMHELSLSKRIVFLFLYFVVYLCGWQLWLSGIVYHNFGRNAYYLGYLIVYLLLMVIFYLIAMSWYQDEWNRFLQNKGDQKAVSVYTVAALFTSVFILNLILFGVFHVDTPDNQANNLAYLQADPFGFVISTLLFAPFMEETIFRGCIFAPMRKKHPFFFSAFVSGLCFGLLHILASVLSHDYSQCIYALVYGLCGFVLAIPYEKTGSIFAGMLTHMLYNLLGMIFMLI